MYTQMKNLLLNNSFLLRLHLFKNLAMFKYLFHLTEQILMFFSIDQDFKNGLWINFKEKKTKTNEKKWLVLVSKETFKKIFFYQGR